MVLVASAYRERAACSCVPVCPTGCGKASLDVSLIPWVFPALLCLALSLSPIQSPVPSGRGGGGGGNFKKHGGSALRALGHGRL